MIGSAQWTKETLMAVRKSQKPRRPRRRSKETLKEIYARIKREFSAADLQKYTVIEKGIPAEKVLAQMERIHRRITNQG
jgi:hypothetical protein